MNAYCKEMVSNAVSHIMGKQPCRIKAQGNGFCWMHQPETKAAKLREERTRYDRDTQALKRRRDIEEAERRVIEFARRMTSAWKGDHKGSYQILQARLRTEVERLDALLET